MKPQKLYDGTCKFHHTVTIDFTQSWNGQNVTTDDFGIYKYTVGDVDSLKIDSVKLEDLQYLISDIRFYKANGDSVLMDMYQYIKISDVNTLTTVLEKKIDPIELIGIGFNFGFSPEDNIDGKYLDLNLLGWSWPAGLDGGYHQMKMDGKFINNIGVEQSFNFHNGSSTKQAMTSEVAVPNYIFVKLDQVITMDTDKTIEINMKIEEWFKDPYTWDLNTNYSDLMGNKEAQLRMSANGATVFAIGEVK